MAAGAPYLGGTLEGIVLGTIGILVTVVLWVVDRVRQRRAWERAVRPRIVFGTLELYGPDRPVREGFVYAISFQITNTGGTAVFPVVLIEDPEERFQTEPVSRSALVSGGVMTDATGMVGPADSKDLQEEAEAFVERAQWSVLCWDDLGGAHIFTPAGEAALPKDFPLERPEDMRNFLLRYRNRMSPKRGSGEGGLLDGKQQEDNRSPLTARGEDFLAYTNALIPTRIEAVREIVVLLRTILTRDRFESRNFSTLMVGWIGFMCDCAELMVHALRLPGLEARAGAWLRPIVEASIHLHWVDEDAGRATRALRSQLRSWQRQDSLAKGTVFEREPFDAPAELLEGPGLPSVADMAATLGVAEAMIFKLESEALHAGAANALAYVDLTDDSTIQLRSAPERPGRISGTLAVSLACLLKAGYELSRRYGMGLEPQLDAIATRAEVSPDFNVVRNEMWREMWRPESGFVTE